MPISISCSPNSKIGRPEAGMMHELSATPMVRVQSTAFFAAEQTSASLAPSSARAPAALITNKSPAIPRLSWRRSGGAEATSSLTLTVSTRMFSVSNISAATSKLSTSPE